MIPARVMTLQGRAAPYLARATITSGSIFWKIPGGRRICRRVLITKRQACHPIKVYVKEVRFFFSLLHPLKYFVVVKTIQLDLSATISPPHPTAFFFLLASLLLFMRNIFVFVFTIVLDISVSFITGLSVETFVQHSMRYIKLKEISETILYAESMFVCRFVALQEIPD